MGHHLVPIGMGLECYAAGESQPAWAGISSVRHGKLSSFVGDSMVSTSSVFLYFTLSLTRGETGSLQDVT